MISKKIEKALNKQVQIEAQSSAIYLSMASWCDRQGLEGAAQFMFRQSAEEHEHMMKIFNYLLEMDGQAIVPAISQPAQDFKNVPAMFKEVYKHEQFVTKSINDLSNLAAKEGDNSTTVFLQWFIDEQREEESLMRGILDKIRLIGGGPQSLYYIDKEIEIINQKELKKEAAGE